MALFMPKKGVGISHNDCVLSIAEQLKKGNWEVYANLEGWNKPAKVGSKIPDVLAKKKGCITRICEVAAPEMFEGDKDRYQELKNYCDEYDFHFFMIKDGKQVEIDPENQQAKK
jgi:hypothetical protein